MNSRHEQKGTVLVIVAILLPVLLGGLGLVIDNGQAFEMRRRLQSAADAGAISAAHSIRSSGSRTNIQQAVIDNVKRNGFTAPATSITVSNPPTSGKHTADPDYVEVLLQHDAPLYFMKAIYGKQLKVAARAVSAVKPWSYCMLVLNKTASKALNITGNSVVDASVCNVQVDSNASNAASSAGGATFKAGGTKIVGNYSGGGFTPTPQTAQPYVADPLAKLAAPTIGACTFNSQLSIKTSITLNPGVYCGGIVISSGATAKLNKGVYIMKGGGLTVQGGGSLVGNEVMIYNTNGSSSYAPIDITGGATVTLTPPLTGTYRGVILFTDRTITSTKPNVLTSSSVSHFTGTVYFPSTPLKFSGSADLFSEKTLLIVDTIEFAGNIVFDVLTAQDGVSEYTMNALLVD